MCVGVIENINTTGSLQGETWADGDVLYLSPTTAGAITKVKPTGLTGHIVVVGYVEYAHANNGKIYVKIMNGWELDELHNVYINNPANNEVLTYESATSLWKNKAISTGLTTGITTIASGTNTNILYNNSGVLGEYAVTGTGTTAVLSTSPTFNGKVEIGTGTTGISTTFSSLRVGVNNGLVDVGSIATGYSTIWLGQSVPSASNYSILMTGSTALTMQASSSVQLSYSQGTSSFTLNATGLVLSSGLSFNSSVTSSGFAIPFNFVIPTNTGQTVSTNIPNFRITGANKQWATGTIANQYWNYLTANTASFVGASIMTNSYSLFVESAAAGTNATITNNYAAGFNGNVEVKNDLVVGNPKFTIELVDSQTVNFYNRYAMSIDSITNVLNSPTITIQDDNVAYTLGTTIAIGSKITITASTASVVVLNATRI